MTLPSTQLGTRKKRHMLLVWLSGVHTSAVVQFTTASPSSRLPKTVRNSEHSPSLPMHLSHRSRREDTQNPKLTSHSRCLIPRLWCIMHMQPGRDPARKGRNGIKRTLGRPAKTKLVRLFKNGSKLSSHQTVSAICRAREVPS